MRNPGSHVTENETPDPPAFRGFQSFGHEPDRHSEEGARAPAAQKPGDTLRYRLTAESVLLDKAPASVCGDPFAVFSEWSGEADEKAYDGPPAAPPRRLALWSVLGELRLMLSGYRSHL